MSIKKSIGFILSSYITLSSAMFFHMGEKEEKCIIEDIPSDIIVTGYFKMELWDVSSQGFQNSAPNLGMTVTVRHPDSEILMTKKYDLEGKFTFKSESSGQHFICLESNSPRLAVFAGDKLRVHLDIQVGEHRLDETASQAQDTVKDVKYTMIQLIEQVKYISSQQNYQREREENFRQTSQDTNSSVFWWALVQTIMLITVGIWQMKQMKDFLIEKKLV
ncbi:transmembrane emp24 domain-containing protein 11 [Polyodon spathula]|nr:transmembrane emp24 domain-containing protein 11 [Polyodon spathula]